MVEKDAKMSAINPNKATPDKVAATRQSRNLLTWVIWIVLAVGVLALARWQWVRATPVMAVQPQRGTLVAEVFGTGTLEAKVVVVLSTKITGKVTEVLVDQGGTATEGQVVARLEATDYENAERVADAALGQSHAELAKAKLDLERNRDLLQSHTISQAEFDTANTSYRVAEAKLKSAEANLGFARARLADTVIYSPIAGLVLVRNLEVGDTVVPGTPIFRVADTKQLWIAAMVDEREAGRLRMGEPARITFRAQVGQSFPGRLVRLAREADRVTEELEADVAADRLPAEWLIGAKADVYIETARKADALQIAHGAIVRHGDQPGVLVIDSGRARWQPVQVGLVGREAVELVSGVKIGDWIIAEPFAGKESIADGQRVTAPAVREGP